MMTEIIAKPAGSTWTDDQWEAIVRNGENILVAAAAGSGKTAVLVERIIRRISDERHPMDVDRLLVATFTKAAAAEMRSRIRDALEAELQKRPDSRHLRSQLALLGKASITTLHSFCMEVIQRHYQTIGLDPGFRIANETEAALMRQDLLEELIEDCYATSEEDSSFWKLADAFGGERGDDGLFRLIHQLYEASRSHPDPGLWLKETAAMFAVPREEGVDHPWQRSLAADVRLELNGAAGLVQEAIRVAESPGGPAPYLENLRQEADVLEYLAELCGHSWDVLHEGIQSPVFGRLKPCKGEGFDKGLQEKTKELRDGAKDRLKKIQTELFRRTSEDYFEELRLLAPLMEALVQLVLSFGERFEEAKRRKGLLDFGDLEHYCLRILRSSDAEPGVLAPTPAAMEYRDYFSEILLDEYQDTNRVQEAIIELISKDGAGNRFMVGDVKQSIYRFRLAEPGLFLAKYKEYRREAREPGVWGAPELGGRRIDLARNFRSRSQVVDGVNFLFRQIMEEAVGEIRYDEKAELVCGAAYGDTPSDCSVGLMLIDKGSDASSVSGGDSASEEAESSGDNAGNAEEMTEEPPLMEEETALLEARLIAGEINRLMGRSGELPFQVSGKKGESARPASFKDIVILMRSAQQWAPVFMEELKRQGIPVYAELNAGYFTAMEVDVVLSLLKIIDNPYQDIPLAGVLRSPVGGFSTDELGRIRGESKEGSFYEAVETFAKQAVTKELAGDCTSETDTELADRLADFLTRLEHWRTEARQGPVADLIWSLYRQTGYFDFVGGLPGGMQRQANLRALYDRARMYEATSFRGLFRFLRFIGRMRDSGGDLGTARSLGEQEDVVRIMTIHKSKGLEFPVVFVAGTGKMFNRMDLNGSFLLHKDLGFGPKFVDSNLRISYPTLPALAIRRRIRMELLAEEMRVLYVALTRAREKLLLVGTSRSLPKQISGWSRQLLHSEGILPDYELAWASSYLDWIGPAVIRHPDAALLREAAGYPVEAPVHLLPDSSKWTVTITRSREILTTDSLSVEAAAAAERTAADLIGAGLLGERAFMEALERGVPVPAHDPDGVAEIERRLSWQYPFESASRMLSKTTVTELKRLGERNAIALLADPESALDEESFVPGHTQPREPVFRRPKFLEDRKLNATERGTVYHTVMQLLPLDRELDEPAIAAYISELGERRLLTHEQCRSVDPAVIASFFATGIGRRMVQAGPGFVHRETPFTYRLRAGDIYSELSSERMEEALIIQGIVDCLVDDEHGLTMIDYKTDSLRGKPAAERAESYRKQIELYSRAVEEIWQRKLSGAYLFFFDGAQLVDMSGGEES